jgi:hypothetical protein
MLFEQQNSLRGTVFFFRFPEHTSDSEQLFVTALAYQLGVNLPATIPVILGEIRSDPYILTRNTKKQMRRLVLEPLRQAGSSKSTNIFTITTIPELSDAIDLSSINHAIDAAIDNEGGGHVRFLVLKHGMEDSCAYFRPIDSLILPAGDYFCLTSVSLASFFPFFS